MTVKVKKLTDTAKLPTYGSKYSTCCDLYADIPEDYGLAITPHQTVMIHTGLSFQPPKRYYGVIYARSGLSSKEGLRPANCVGVCDEDYRGEYMVALHNDSEETRYVYGGDRIAQLMFVPYEQVEFIEVDSLCETERGNGGFGSTGK